jgi:putative hydrolase of the HAD superfamily
LATSPRYAPDVIDAVFLDVGGVFVMPAHALILSIAAAHGGGRADESLDLAHYHGVAAGETAVERGGPFDWNAYRHVLLRHAGVREPELQAASDELAAALTDPAVNVWNQPMAGAADGLLRLAEAGVPLAVVSNADGTIAQLLAELGLCQLRESSDGADLRELQVGGRPIGVGTLMEAIVDSTVVGVEKPDPAIFAIALAAVGTEAARTVHVGDTIHADVVGAHAAGLRPLHLDPIGWCSDPTHEHVKNLAGVADLIAAERP